MLMSMRMLSFIYVIVCGLFEWNQIFQVFFIICLYMYCYWRSNYQEGVGIPLSVLTPSHMYDHFSFCWNSWPSLFKLSFYKLDWAWNKGYLEIQLILSYTLTYTSKLKWGPFENETIRQKRLFQFFHYELSI